jgi:hypothetical protein
MTDDPDNFMSEDFVSKHVGYPHTPLSTPVDTSESTEEQLSALEEKLDDVLAFMARLIPLVEYAEKMMLATRKEQVKMFLTKGK